MSNSETKDILVGEDEIEDAQFHHEVLNEGRILVVIPAGTVQLNDRIRLVLSNGDLVNFPTRITRIEPKSIAEELIEIDVDIAQAA